LIGFDAHKRVNGTKIHAAVNEQSAPVAVAIGEGDEHEGRKLIPLMQSIRVERRKRGRPRKNPKQVYADTKYSMTLNRFYLDKRKIVSHIPSREKKKRTGRPRLLDKAGYKKVRYTVERFFAWTENFRKLTIRYERLAEAFSGLFHIACIMILWKVLR
jgi:transposase